MIKIGNVWYLKGDMHIHTNFSDGEALEENIAAVVNCGMDFCAVTDHDTYGGSSAAQQLLKESGSPFPILIRGQEATCAGCHLLAYGTLTAFDKTGAPAAVCANIRNAGGYAVAAHPDWDMTRSSFRESGIFQQLVDEGLVDGVELMNFDVPKTPEEIPEEWTNRFYQMYQEAGKPFPVTVGSDAHRACNITPERFVAVFAEQCDEAGILEAIFKKRLSVAVWGEYAFGTPEALELYRKAKAAEELSAADCKLFSARNDAGEIFSFTPPPEKCYVCGVVSKQAENCFFKSGFAGGNGLLLFENKGKRSAVSLRFADAVQMKCLPVWNGGKLVPQLDFSCEKNDAGQNLFFSGSVNGKPFTCETGENFTLPDHPLRTDGRANDIFAEVRAENGILLGRKRWDFPIALPGQWYELENLHIETPSAGDREVSGRFRLQQLTNGNTILEMEIDDPCFYQPYCGFPMYMGDSIQFGLDFSCAASENDLVEKKIWELGIAMTPEGCELTVYNTPAGHSREEVGRISYTGERIGDLQRYRLELPPEFAGKRFGFNMIYNINDGGGRRGYLGWRNGIADRKCSADWGIAAAFPAL